MTSSTTPAPPPAALRARVLAASLSARPAGRTTPVADPISPVEAFRRSADALAVLLGSIPGEQWAVPVLRGLDVQGLIGHLTGVEEDLQQALAGAPDVADTDHIAGTQPAADRQHGRLAEATRREWNDVVARTLRLLTGADLDRTAALHGTRMPVSALCVARTFELWTHENDIRQALGQPATVPDASTLTLMTQLAVHLLPGAVSRSVAGAHPAPAPGRGPSITLRLVLTGPGGGTWQLALGAQALGAQALGVQALGVQALGVQATAPQGAGIVADAVGFCRLVANRTTPADLDAHITGDPALATAVLHAMSTLALD